MSRPPAIALIPARYASTRFPGKVLANRTGRPMIAHVYEAAASAGCVRRTVVATDDRRVLKAVKEFGGEAVMTSPDHSNGSSRLAEAAEVLGLHPDHVVVNVQGDEPEIDPRLIDECYNALLASGASVATLASPFAPGDDVANPNVVKVVRRENGSAMYFSRAPIPYARDRGADARPLRHVGIYAYRVAFLRKYAAMPRTPLETAEGLEQLRVLEHGYAVAVAVQPSTHAGVDTPEQYEAFVARWRARAL